MDLSHAVQHPASGSTSAPALSATGISKQFGRVTALSDVSLEVASGEVVALMGDNGAGKSTLVKILSGVHALDRGELSIRSERVDFSSPSDARAAGIETVYQDLALADDLSAPANLFLGREHRKRGLRGKLGGQELIKQAPQGGEVVFVHIKPGINSIDDRDTGFKQAFSGQSKYTVLPEFVRRQRLGDPGREPGVGHDLGTSEARGHLRLQRHHRRGCRERGEDRRQDRQDRGPRLRRRSSGGRRPARGSLTALVSQNPFKIGQMPVADALKYLTGDWSIPKDQPLTPLVITKHNLNDPASQTALYK
jgi:ABC-type sugar transport system ATPase subunit